jgi:hypothetical protein
MSDTSSSPHDNPTCTTSVPASTEHRPTTSSVSASTTHRSTLLSPIGNIVDSSRINTDHSGTTANHNSRPLGLSVVMPTTLEQSSLNVPTSSTIHLNDISDHTPHELQNDTSRRRRHSNDSDSDDSQDKEIIKRL